MERAQWRTVPIRDVYQALYDGPHATPKPSEAGPVFLGIKNVTDDGQLDLSDVRHIAEEDYAKWTRRVEPRPGDLVFTYEATLNRYAIIPEGFRGCLGRRMALIRVDPTQLDVRFLLYYFFTPEWRAVITSKMLSGATVDRIPLTTFPDFPVRVPPLEEQRRITGILSVYDQLIENSQRRIRILETMARALYREWFVHFRFPGHENVSRVASPLGEIPKGWDVVALDALKADQRYAINGGPFGSKLVSRDYVDAGVPVIRGSNLSESGRFDASEFVFVSEEKAEELHANVAVPGDIVITQRGTLGQIGMIPPGTGFDRFVISQSQMKATLSPEAVNREYTFFFLRSEEAQQRIRNLASSSGVPHINLATLREFQVLLPPRGLQQKFGEFALGTEGAVEQLCRQIEALRRTRDLLLPRLLSGQVLSGKLAGEPLRDMLPRVFELRETLSDPLHPDAYFQNFEPSLKANQLKLGEFQRLERLLKRLDDPGWHDLKARAAAQLQRKDPIRGWQALFDTMGEAKGFVYLQHIGCIGVRFIPRPMGMKKMVKTPDLEGLLGKRVLCEVKTINISKDEAERRNRMHRGEIAASEVSTLVGEAFLGKVRSKVDEAIGQLDAQDPDRKARRIVFAVIHFDDWVGDYQAEYFEQIDEALLKTPVSGAELVFSPASNLFSPIPQMKSATVFEFE